MPMAGLNTKLCSCGQSEALVTVRLAVVHGPDSKVPHEAQAFDM